MTGWIKDFETTSVIDYLRINYPSIYAETSANITKINHEMTNTTLRRNLIASKGLWVANEYHETLNFLKRYSLNGPIKFITMNAFIYFMIFVILYRLINFWADELNLNQHKESNDV